MSIDTPLALAVQIMAEEFVKTLKLSYFDGSMQIYPDCSDEDNCMLCAFAYATASTGKVTITREDGHSIVRLVTR